MRAVSVCTFVWVAVVAGGMRGELRAGPVIGVFDSVRQGRTTNILSGELASALRRSLEKSFPQHSMETTSRLTSEFLAGVDVLIIHNARESLATPVLTDDESTALRQFVENGGSTFVLADGFFPQVAANFVAPFEMEVSANHLDGRDQGVVLDSGHPIVRGVSTYWTEFQGWFTNLGPYAKPLATLGANDEPSLAVIEPGAIALGSGPVVVTTDANAIANSLFDLNETLVRNIVGWLSAPGCLTEEDPSEDCNGNGLDDACEIASAISPDCNANDVPDRCDVEDGVEDLDEDGIPDECPGERGLQLPGDLNQDGDMDLSDAVTLFGFLFGGTPSRLPCGDGTTDDRGNVLLTDHNNDGTIDVSDGIAALTWLFGNGAPHPLTAGGEETEACVLIVGCPDTSACS